MHYIFYITENTINGKRNPSYGKPRSAETRRKISETMKRKHAQKESK